MKKLMFIFAAVLTAALFAAPGGLPGPNPEAPGVGPAKPDKPAPVEIKKEPTQFVEIKIKEDPKLVGKLAVTPAIGKDADGVFMSSEQYAALTNAVEMMSAIIEKLWDMDHKEQSGRKRWHGKILATSSDTNLLVKTEIYEDGYQFCESWKPKESRAVKEDPEARLKRQLERIDADPTLPEEVKELKKQRILAKISTNEVSQIVRPQ